MQDFFFSSDGRFIRFLLPTFVELLVRYFWMAGVGFLLFYVLWKKPFQRRKIQPAFPTRSDYAREIGYSVVTAVIFAVVGWFAFSPILKPFTHWYFKLGAHSGWYFGFSVVAMIVIHDAYFYWTHRMMHWRPLYRVMHQLHHKSTNPSPWAAYSFHPLEAVVEASIVVVFAFVLPVHPLALAIFLVWMTAFNVSGHLGYELYPRWLTSGPLGRWLNTSTNHNQHHKYFRGNYGLYFRWWDEWFKTTQARYLPELSRMQAEPYLKPTRAKAWKTSMTKLWMLAPYAALGIGLLVIKNAWVALAAFHGVIVVALVLHRRQWSIQTLWKGGRLLYLPAIGLAVGAFGFWLSDFAGQYSGYSNSLRKAMASVQLSGSGLIPFAIYFCAINPLLEEAFWRGLFFSNKRRLTFADVAYGGIHFPVLLPFMDLSHAAIGAIFLIGMGYLWRQIAGRSEGLAMPLAWHAFGDFAIVMTISGILLSG